MFTNGNISAKNAPNDEAKLEELENQMQFIRVLISICEQTTSFINPFNCNISQRKFSININKNLDENKENTPLLSN